MRSAIRQDTDFFRGDELEYAAADSVPAEFERQRRPAIEVLLAFGPYHNPGRLGCGAPSTGFVVHVFSDSTIQTLEEIRSRFNPPRKQFMISRSFQAPKD